ncbi:MAG: efflux RND transporter permease subunit [Polyangiaceae bacterium]|nr:efflux RND transporter permease subunit [Polyangiaceae bacterium]
MLARVIELSLRYRAVVLLSLLVLAVAGTAALRQLPLDAFPDTTPVQVTVNTTAPALAPEEIERQITFPLEQRVGGLPGLTEVRSVSKFGFSQLVLVFADDVDVYRARQLVAERLQSAPLPAGVSPPALGPVTTGLGEVFQYLVRGEGRTAMELRTLHDWVIRPQLLSVPGIAEVNTWGGYQQQLHVVVDPNQLLKHELTLDQVVEALRRNNTSVGGGYAEKGGEALLIQGLAVASTREDIERIVVDAVQGVPIRIADVAKVELGHEIRRGAVTSGGQGEVVLGLGFMVMGQNSRAVTRALEARIGEVRASLPPGVTIEPVYTRSSLVDHVLATVRTNLLEGALLVVAVLFLLLGNLRAGLIVALAIPLSMLFAFNAMLRVGIAGSLMSLGAIDFGLIVDSSVIMIENAERRLAVDPAERTVTEVVRDAALEVRRPTLFGELIIAIVYLPILALEGYEGKLFRPMAATVIFALAGSMLLSVTAMPALASLFLRRRKAAHDAILVRALRRVYRPVLERAIRHRVVVLVVAGWLVVSAGVAAWSLGTEFVPRLREGAVVVNTIRLAGVSLTESVRYGGEIEKRLLKEFPDEIERIWTRTGTAEVATDPMGMELSDVFVTLKPRDRWKRAKTQDQLVGEMSRVLDGMPGMRSVFTQPIEMRMNEMIAGIRADVGIQLFGDDLATLREKAAEIRARVEQVPGAADVSVEQLTGQPVLEIEVDREAAGRVGVAAEDVLETVESLGTRKVGEVRQGQMRFDLAVRLTEADRTDPETVGRLLVDAPGGKHVTLGSVTKIRVREGPSTLQRKWGKRRVIVQANARGRDVGSFVSDVRRAVDEDVRLPMGYYVRYGGQFEHLERARERLMVVVPIALVLVFTLLYITYGRALDALRVFVGVPFAAVGGVMALWLRGMPLSISAGVGFVALSGVAVLGDMVLASHIRQLVDGGMPMVDAIRQAADTRLRPVLMTGLVASLGFLPMAFNTGIGAEVQAPLATVVIGGIVTSTLATLIVLPILYSFRRGARAAG